MPNVIPYIHDNGRHCLYCGSPDLIKGDIMDRLERVVSCTSCSHRWVEVLEIKDVRGEENYIRYSANPYIQTGGQVWWQTVPELDPRGNRVTIDWNVHPYNTIGEPPPPSPPTLSSDPDNQPY